jgi:hypothetical protein
MTCLSALVDTNTATYQTCDNGTRGKKKKKRKEEEEDKR